MNGDPKNNYTKGRGRTKAGNTSINGIFPSIPVNTNPVINRYMPTITRPVSPPPQVISPPRVASPRDITQILMNGEPVDLEPLIEERILGNDDYIKPLSPVPQVPIMPVSPYRESNMSPNNYIQNNIKIVETPKVEKEPTPKYEFHQATPTNSEPSVFPLNEKNDSPVSSTSSKEKKKRNLMSLLPKYKNIKNISPVTEVFHSDDDNSDSEEDKPPAPLNIQVPVFRALPRVVSPVNTIDPKSPGVVRAISPPVRAITPPKLPVPETKISPLPKAPSPRPMPRAPSPVAFTIPKPLTPVKFPQNEEENIQQEPQNPVTEVSPLREQPMYISEEQHKRVTYRPDYSKLSKEQELYFRHEFKIRFEILRRNNPDYNIFEPHESFTIDQIHDLYDHHVRHIMVSKETGNYKVYMVIILMFIEVIGVKVLKLNMSGYTMSQMRIINRYDALFIELGEKWTSSGGSNWPIEARICMMILFNAVIFLVVRYLCKWIGFEGMAEPLQNMIDNMLNGTSNSSSNREDYNKPSQPQQQSQQQSSSFASEPGNPFDKLTDMFSGFMSKNSGNIAEKVAQFGTTFTKNMQNNNAEAAAKPKQAAAPPAKKKINKKKLFSDSD